MTDWDEQWRENGEKFNRWPSTDLVRWASTLKPGSRVLEVGCGAGPNLLALESFGMEAWGVDVSSEAAKAAESLLEASRAVVLAPVSATELPIADGYFDAVCDVQCFQHLAHQAELQFAYTEAARVLKPGGRFFELFLAQGQERYPDLSFAEFDIDLIFAAGFSRLRTGGAQHGWWPEDPVVYVKVDAVK